jgi:hypothetical protein
MNEAIKLKETMDIDALLEENGGELTPEIEAEYDRLHGDDFSKIVESRIRTIKRFEAMADGLKKEASDMAFLGQVKRNAADQMRRSLVAEMGLKGQRKVITGPWTVSLAKKPARITLKEGTDLKNIEENLKRHVPEKWELDKMAVRTSLKSRGLIPTEIGAWEVEDFDVEIGERLNIR